MRRARLFLVVLPLLGCARTAPRGAVSAPSLRCELLDADRLTARPAAAGSIARGPIRVHYCDALLLPLAERVLRYALRSHRLQTGALGFPLPLPDGDRGGGPELDLYLVNLGRGGRAQANEEPQVPSARTAAGYIVLDYRTEEASGYLASYVAHEMHHVLQYALSRKAPAALLEATAAYVDDQLHPEARAIPAMVADFQREPERALYARDEQTSYDYGAAMFVGYLVFRHGAALLREVIGASDEDFLSPLDAALRRRGADLVGAATEFARLRVRTGRYARGGEPPGWGRFPEVALDRAVSPFSFLSEPLSLRPQRAPEELGTVYFGLDLTTPLGGGLAIEVTADAGHGRLCAQLLTEDALAPLSSALIVGGQRAALRARAPRPGARLWLAVSNLGPATGLTMRARPEETAQGFAARFERLPEP